MNTQEHINFLQTIDADFDKVLKIAFPWIEIEYRGNAGPQFHAFMPTQNNSLKNSPYFYNETTEFFHITTIQNVLSIINNESIRLYNLHSSEDESEFIYGAKLLGLLPTDILQGKGQVFTFSFCPISELHNPEIWEKHSDDFKKAAIIFEIRNDISKWQKFHISKVYYEEPESFKLYKAAMEDLKHKYPQLTFFTDLNPVIPFYKTRDYSVEKEVRLIGNFPFQNPAHSYRYIKSDFRVQKDRNRITDYIELPISKESFSWGDSNLKDELFITRKNYPEEIFITTPEIRIKDIVFGKNCGIPELDLINFQNKLQSMILLNFGYNIFLTPNYFNC